MANGTEQVPAPEIKKEPAPSNPQDAYNRFLKVKAEKDALAAKAPDPSADGLKDGQKADPEKKVAAPNPWEGYRIVDKDGNPAKLPLSVDGKTIELDDMNKIGTTLQFGLHHDKRGQALKEQEEAINKRITDFEVESSNFKKGMPFLQKLQQAIEEGKLRIADDGSVSRSPGGPVVDPDHIPLTEDDLEMGDTQYIDLAKRFNKMIDTNKKLTTDLNALKSLQLAQLFKEKKTEIDSEISRLKPSYPLALEKDVIDYLAELNDQNMPRYSIEEAMKLSQEDAKVRFDSYIKQDPDFMNKSQEQKDLIIKEYLAKVEEKNKPPVSGPQGTGAAGAALQKKDHDPNRPMSPQERKAEASAKFSAASTYLNQKLAQGRKA